MERQKRMKPVIMYIHNSIIDIRNSIMDIYNSIMDIHNSIMDIHNGKPITNKTALWISIIMDTYNYGYP